MFETLASQTTPAQVRSEYLEGRDHWVVPMVMLTEGVHAGSNGPILYPKEELVKNTTGWDHKPVVVYHPMIGGKQISACDPSVLTKQKIGIVLNTVFNGKLKAEAWLDKQRTLEVDSRITQNLLNNQITEISTGLHLDAEKADGEFNGAKYTMIGRNYRPDHLAVLPDQVGACSIAKGAGLLVNSSELNFGIKLHKDVEQSLRAKLYRALNRETQFVGNELSFSDIRGNLYKALAAKFGDPGEMWDGYIDEVFSDYVIFCDGGSWKIGYKITDTTVSLEGEATAVVAVTEYKPVSSEASSDTYTTEGNDTTMNKQTLIAAILAANAKMFDKASLELLPEDALTKIKENLTVNTSVPVTVPTPAPAPVAAPAVPRQPTLEEYIANAPPAIAALLTDSLAVQQEERTKLVKEILACNANIFTESNLNTKPTHELKAIHKMAVAASVAAQPQVPTANALYIGAPGAYTAPVANLAGSVPEPLPLLDLYPSK